MDKKYIYGVDVGGTTCKIGRFDIEGNLLDKWEIPTRKEENGSRIIPDVADAIKDNMKNNNITVDEVVGAGLGVPGPVRSDGTIDLAVNLGWDRWNPTKTLNELLGIPVRASNDANIAALGEQWKGAGQGYDNLVMVTLGTGIGGGVIVDGKIVNGATGAGGEIGHIHIEDDETDMCNCGGYGCMEQYGSATGIVKIAQKFLDTTDTPSVLRNGSISAKAIWDAVKAGDPLAEEIAQKYGFYLGKGLSVVAGVTNPEAFIIGGGVSKAGEILFDYIVPYYNRFVFRRARDVKFILATLGNDAGIYGAARLVLE